MASLMALLTTLSHERMRWEGYFLLTQGHLEKHGMVVPDVGQPARKLRDHLMVRK